MSDVNGPKKGMGHFEYEAYFNSFFMLLPAIIGIPTVMLIPTVQQSPRTAAVLAIALGAGGFILFSIAKFSMFRQGHWLTWDSSRMTAKNRMFYRTGYALIVASGFLSFAMLMVGKMEQTR